jgi:DNA-binding cell septation regulator SpoVG
LEELGAIGDVTLEKGLQLIKMKVIDGEDCVWAVLHIRKHS